MIVSLPAMVISLALPLKCLPLSSTCDWELLTVDMLAEPGTLM